jgi:hypothetical protein
MYLNFFLQYCKDHSIEVKQTSHSIKIINIYGIQFNFNAEGANNDEAIEDWAKRTLEGIIKDGIASKITKITKIDCAE